MSDKRILTVVLAISAGLMVIKFVAWYMTRSAAILTDAVESIINVVAGSFALYSTWLASLPPDKEHLYGHGKIEFFSAGFEGGLILIAGVVMGYESILSLIDPISIKGTLVWGTLLTGLTGVINGGVGLYLTRIGKKKRQMVLQAEGQHLLSDAYSSVGLVLGLIVVMVTGLAWLDAVIALFLAFIVVYSGYKLVRRSISGLMDETDLQLLTSLVEHLNQSRQPEWIDLHNVRLMYVSDGIHLDGHVVFPYYFTVDETSSSVLTLEQAISNNLGVSAEVFLHIDSCQKSFCSSCPMNGCPNRQENYIGQKVWSTDNIVEKV